MIKDAKQIETIRRAGKILAHTLSELQKASEPGATGTFLDDLAYTLIKKKGAEPAFKGFNSYPYTICLSINDEVVHGLPENKVLVTGDLVSIDCGVKLGGLNTDAAISFIVDENDSNKQEAKMINDAWKAFNAGLAKVRHGAHVGDVCAAIENVIRSGGYGLIRNLTGHGIGESLHEPPTIPNYGKAGTGPILKSGMIICIEPMITLGGSDIKTASDGWTILSKDGSRAAHVEHTILVTQNGAEILSKL